MTRKLLVAAAAVAVALAVAGPASAELASPLVLAPPPPDLLVSSNNAETFTITNVPCGASEICFGGPGASAANNFRVTVTNHWYSWTTWGQWNPHWVSSSVSYDVATLAPGASLAFPYRFYGLSYEFVSVTVDSLNSVRERNESNNSWSI